MKAKPSRIFKSKMRAAMRYSKQISRPGISMEVSRRDFVDFKPRHNGSFARSVELKVSKRPANLVLESRAKLPYIDKLGKFSGLFCGEMKMTQASYVFTVVATIFNRLNYRAHFYSKQNVSNFASLLMKVSYYYAISKNDWYLNRILVLLKDISKNQSAIHSLTQKFLSKQDDHTRFVCSQVCFQTSWLKIRGSRPRDKSHFDYSRIPIEEFSFLSRDPRYYEGYSYRHVSRKIMLM